MPKRNEIRRQMYELYESAQVMADYLTRRIYTLYGESWRITFDQDIKWRAIDATATVVADHGTFETYEVLETFLLTEFPLLDEEVEALTAVGA